MIFARTKIRFEELFVICEEFYSEQIDKETLILLRKRCTATVSREIPTRGAN